VKYLRLDRRRSLGAKLNLGIELAAGTLIQKLDDDDYYAPGFLATSVARIRNSRLRRSIAVWDCFLALLVTEPKLALYYSGHGWLAGGTMCFRRSIWEEAPFRKITWGEDSAFFEDHPGPRLRICAPEQYIIVRHGRNTWRRFVDGRRVESFFRERRPYRKSLAEVAGDQAAGFYARLNRSAGA
jgi:glycosyltransferase involved in cell wall biosynthesis